MAFDWQDPLQLRAQLAPEEAAAAESAARFARERLAPGVTRAFREASFDRTLVADFGAMGLFGLAGILLILLAFIMVWRVSARAAPEEHEQEDWSPILPTPLASVELDPRNPERESES